MDRILIKNGFLITMDKDRKIIKNGGVVVEGNKIVDVGRSEQLEKKQKADIVIDATHKVIMPGLVNTHTHLYQTLLRNLGEDSKLTDWLPNVIYSTINHFHEEESYYGALLGCLELIRSGCTCTVDNGVVTSDEEVTDKCMEALLNIGIRGIEAKSARDADIFGMSSSENLQDTKDAIRSTVRTIEQWHGKDNGRISVMFGPGTVRSCSAEFLEEASRIASKHGIGISIHLHETKDEVDGWQKRFGSTPIAYLKKNLSFLGPNTLAVHCVWVDAEDIKILKETGTKVSHNPVSNMYLASGIAPILKMLEVGITVGLGVDGAASNNSQDMFELMKMAVLLQKVHTLDPIAITAEKALEMATLDGAKAIGLENEIGSLELGKRADIILIDLKQPNMVPLNRVHSQLVYCAKGRNVNTVIIDGKIVMDNGKMMTVDEGKVLEKAQEVSDQLIERSGIEHLRNKPWKRF